MLSRGTLPWVELINLSVLYGKNVNLLYVRNLMGLTNIYTQVPTFSYLMTYKVTVSLKSFWKKIMSVGTYLFCN